MVFFDDSPSKYYTVAPYVDHLVTAYFHIPKLSLGTKIFINFYLSDRLPQFDSNIFVQLTFPSILAQNIYLGQQFVCNRTAQADKPRVKTRHPHKKFFSKHVAFFSLFLINEGLRGIIDFKSSEHTLRFYSTCKE